MPSDVKTPGLVINTLTQEQFDDLINPSDTELFLTPDTTAEDIENAVSTHNTDTTAHNDIRTELSGKQDTLIASAGISIENKEISVKISDSLKIDTSGDIATNNVVWRVWD